MTWFVAATNPGGERTAEINLKRQGFQVVLPVHEKPRRHARKVETVRRPVFPGYIFVAFDISTMPWHSINGTLGVRYLITGNGKPMAVNQDFMTELFAALSSDGLIELPEKQFLPGQCVEVCEGPFEGLIGTICNADQQQRIRILLSLMGREVISEVDPGALKHTA